MSENIFAVAGKPILHSQSPFLFRAFFQALNINATYTRISASSAKDALQTADALKLKGMNVTSPLKGSMAKLLDKIDGHSEKINAVNTIVLQQNQWHGYNTDYMGVIQALKYHGLNPVDRNVIVIGAGGAARAAAYGMKMSKARKITIVNRTIDRARLLASRMNCEFAPLKNLSKYIEESDVLISCIPLPLSELDESILQKKIIFMEANYKNISSGKRFKKKEEGNKKIGGLDWLFFQAVPAFRLFTGISIPEKIQRAVHTNFITRKVPQKSHIALIGFMGVGKTTIGRILAKEMGYEFVDIDLTIEEQTGQTIPDIFRLCGEKTFREWETSVIQKTFKESQPKVVSLGGGAVMDEKNCAVVRENCQIVWLWASVRAVINRINLDTRPLLKSSDPKKKAEALLEKRRPFYARLADLVIHTEQGTVLDLVRRIKNEMDKTF